MKALRGVVISAKMTKSAVVRVDRRWMHPVYRKALKRSKTYLIDVGNTAVKEGDYVTIRGTRPKSRRKRWEIIK